MSRSKNKAFWKCSVVLKLIVLKVNMKVDKVNKYNRNIYNALKINISASHNYLLANWIHGWIPQGHTSEQC